MHVLILPHSAHSAVVPKMVASAIGLIQLPKAPSKVCSARHAMCSMSPCRRHCGVITHVAVATLLVLLTALFAVFAILDTRRSHAGRRALWLSVLMGATILYCMAHLEAELANT